MRFLPRKRVRHAWGNRRVCFCHTLAPIIGSFLFLFLLFLSLLTAFQQQHPSLVSKIGSRSDPTKSDIDILNCECNQPQSCSTAFPIGSFVPLDGANVFNSSLTRATLETEKRKRLIKTVTMAAWDAYVRDAWGFDELLPLSHEGKNVIGGMGITIIEAIPTLYIMGLRTRYEAAHEWIQSSLDFDSVSGYFSVHEATSRILGGLMSAYHLTGDGMFLRRAEELGEKLSPAFASGNGIPFPFCRISSPAETHSGASVSNCKGRSISQSAAGGLSLEFRALSFHSSLPNIKQLRCKAERAVHAVVEAGPKLLREGITQAFTESSHDHLNPGLFISRVPAEKPKYSGGVRSVNFRSVKVYYEYLQDVWQSTVATMRSGPALDAVASFSTSTRCFYEYLIKAWRQGGNCEKALKYPADASMDILLRRAIHEAPNADLSLRQFDNLENRSGTILEQSMCYLPSMLHVARIRRDISSRREEHLQEVAESITNSCINMYYKFWPQLGGSTAVYNDKVWVTKGTFELQADLLEALFYMWTATGDMKYREEAWKTFSRISRECAVSSGAFTILVESTVGNVTQGNRMPSWFLGGTLRFLYLIFAEKDMFSSKHWVFNSAGHPLLVTSGIGAMDPC